MADDYKVTIDTSKDKAMFAHIPDKIVRFGQMKNRLCGFKRSEEESNSR